MARNSYFKFKQFRIEQDQCAMKVTADASLFGAIVDVESSERILDIGAGTGLLSLMAAQRSKAIIDAIELDRSASEQCRQNFKESPWSERLRVIHSAIQSYEAEPYDTIICNPPFFENSLKAPDEQRSLARHTDSLTFDELSRDIKRLLSPTGQAWVLLPIRETSSFLQNAERHNLHIIQLISLQSTVNRPAHRNFIVLGSHAKACVESSVIVFEDKPVYSQKAQQLLSSYYLAL